MYETGINGIVRGIEAIAALMIAAAVVAALYRLVVRQLPTRSTVDPAPAQPDVRLQLGQHLVLALEFMIAADILKTVLAPTLQDLAYLGGIILIRTVLSISIAYELRRGNTPKTCRKPTPGDVQDYSSDSQKGCPY